MSYLVPISLVLFQVLVAPGFALWRGGGPERSLAAAFLTDSLLTVVVQQRSTTKFQSPELAILLIDLVMLVIAMAIAIKANRWWPIWFAACHLIAILGHVARLTDAKIGVWTYYTVTSYGAYLLWSLIIAGTIGHELRLRRYGIDPSWKRFSPVLTPPPPAAGRIKF